MRDVAKRALRPGGDAASGGDVERGGAAASRDESKRLRWGWYRSRGTRALAAVACALALAWFAWSLHLESLRARTDGKCDGECAAHILLNGVKRSIGGCKRWTSRCSFWEVVGGSRPPCCQEKVDELMHVLSAGLRERGVEWWAIDGTLIGALRNGKSITWEHDEDVALQLRSPAEYDRVMEFCAWANTQGYDCQPAFSGEYSKGAFADAPVRHGGLLFFYSPTNRNRVDVKFLIRSGESLHKIEYDEYTLERELILPTTPCEFNGAMIPCPHRGAEYLERTTPFEFPDLCIPRSRSCELDEEGCRVQAEREHASAVRGMRDLHARALPSMYSLCKSLGAVE